MSTKKLEQQILDLLDGSIQEKDLISLQAELGTNPEAQDLYRDFVHLKNALELRASAQPALNQPLVPVEELLQKQRSKTLRYSLLATAAILLLSFSALLFFKVPEPQPILTYKTAPDTRFTVSHSAETQEHASGDSTLLAGSRLQLTQGSVEFIFTSGVRSIISAPADITLHSPELLQLDQGSSWFHVPSNAIGFTVKTRHLTIKDLGTEFGVLSSNDARHEVHVFDGAVEVTTHESPVETRHLAKGEAVRQDAYGFLEDITPQPEGFLTALPDKPLHPHWSFDYFKVDASLYAEERNIQTTLHQLADSNEPAPFARGKFGSSIVFDGKTNYVSTNHPGILGDAPRTVAFWVKTPPLRTGDTIPKHIETRMMVGWGIDYRKTATNPHLNHKFTIHFDYALDRYPMLNISYGGFWYYSPGTELDDNEWHHVAVTFDGQYDAQGLPVTKLYVDGEMRNLEHAFDAEQPRTADNKLIIDTQGNAQVLIGANLPVAPKPRPNADDLFTGSLDELYIVERALTHQEVRTLMRSNQLSQ